MKNHSRGRRRAGPTVSSHGVTSLVRGRRRAKAEAPSAVSFRSVGALTGLAVVAMVAAAAALPLDQAGSQEASAGRPQLQTSVKAWPISAPTNEAEPTFSRPTTDSTAAAQKDIKVTPSTVAQPTPEGDATERPAPRTTKSAAVPTDEAAAPLAGVVGEATGAAKDKVAGATEAATDAADKATAAATDAAKPTASPTAGASVSTSPTPSPSVKQSTRAVPEDPEPTRSSVRSKSAKPVEPAPTSETADPEEWRSPEPTPTADTTRDTEREKHRRFRVRADVDVDLRLPLSLLGEDEDGSSTR